MGSDVPTIRGTTEKASQAFGTLAMDVFSNDVLIVV